MIGFSCANLVRYISREDAGEPYSMCVQVENSEECVGVSLIAVDLDSGTEKWLRQDQFHECCKVEQLRIDIEELTA